MAILSTMTKNSNTTLRDERKIRNRRLAVQLFAVALVCGGLTGCPWSKGTPIQFVNSQSGMCLQPINGSHNQGDAVVQQRCNGSAAQSWTPYTDSSGTKVKLENGASNLCLDARGGATNGTPIEQWTCNSISNEVWGYGITNNLLASRVSGTYSYCVATPGNQEGLPMSLQACNPKATNQIWTRPPA